MAEGFIQAGFAIPFASDKSEQAELTYINRHKQLGLNTSFFRGDVSDLSKPNILKSFLGSSINEIDVVCGGPPCQGFSLAGQRNPLDKRNQLVQNYIKILDQVKPKYFVMENVLGILSAKFVDYQGVKLSYINKNVVDVLKSEFNEIGYPDVQVKLLDASDYGVPQKRQRVIFLGTRADISNKLAHPKSANLLKVSAKDAIDDLSIIGNGKTLTEYGQKAKSEYQKQSRIGRTPSSNKRPENRLSNHQTSTHSVLVIERFSRLQCGENIKNMLSRLNKKDSLRLATKKQNCKKIIANEPSPTVLTLPDDLVHYSQNRILTVREMARLQSFDDSFEFLGKRTTGGDRRKLETPQYTLVGNAVPPLLAKAIAEEVMKNLNLECSIESARKTAL
ncbi:MAG: DNA cytosine methyltransferase [Methylotenera sp.]|nr:DNA cytosine methyltransferase [Methylotenera sp.]